MKTLLLANRHRVLLNALIAYGPSVDDGLRSIWIECLGNENTTTAVSGLNFEQQERILEALDNFVHGNSKEWVFDFLYWRDTK